MAAVEQNVSELPSVEKLRWQCRRGMLELDTMLLRFMDKHFSGLDARRRQALETLLGHPDQLLLEYLMGRTIPHDKDVADVAKQIRESAGP